MYEDDEKISNYSEEFRNLTIFGPRKASIGGITGSWELTSKKKDNEVWPFWNEDTKSFTLGDFNSFASYLEMFIGVKEGISVSSSIEDKSESKNE
jgi:hypothetical protein